MKIKMKGKGKAIIGIAMALIMVSSVIAVMEILPLTSGKDVTQTTIRNGYIVNPDNVTISIDGNATSVLIGQNVQFMCDGNKTGTVAVRGVEGTPTEGYLFVSSTTGWLDTSGMVEGLYNATYGEYWELLAVDSPEMDVRFRVDGYEVNSIIGGTQLGIDFTSNLDENDCVDLRIIDPDGNVLKQNPADPNQKFDDINVSQLLEYGSGNESKRINITGWDVGEYEFSVRTEEENARGLDMSSSIRTLAILKAEVNINAEKTCIVELEKVRITVAGASNHNITISSSSPAHTIFPAGLDDNPPYTTSGFNDTLDADGVRKYVVYFNDIGSYTITVTDTTAGLDDTVDITVSGKTVTFDVPYTVVIGEKLDIKGIANTGTYVDIWVDDILYAQLDDLVIDENGEFSEEVTTTDVGMTVPGSVRLKAWIDCDKNPGDDLPTAPADGSAAILLTAPSLTAELSTDEIALGDDFTINGTAKGSRSVDIVIVAPNGSGGSMIDPGGTPLLYELVLTFTMPLHLFLK